MRRHHPRDCGVAALLQRGIRPLLIHFRAWSFPGRLLPAHEVPTRWNQHCHLSTSNAYRTHPLHDKRCSLLLALCALVA
jgi:hypothetical protein